MNQSSYTADTLEVCSAGIRTHQRLNVDSRMTYRIILLLLVCPLLLWESLSKQPLKTGSPSYLLKLPGMVVLRIHLSSSELDHSSFSSRWSSSRSPPNTYIKLPVQIHHATYYACEKQLSF